MMSLKKTWIRVIASLFAGAILAELMAVITFEPGRPQTTNTSLYLFFAVVVYFLLTWYVNKFIKNTPPNL